MSGLNPDHERIARHHLEQAKQWLDLTEGGTHFDPVRDHSSIGLAHAILALVNRLPPETMDGPNTGGEGETE